MFFKGGNELYSLKKNGVLAASNFFASFLIPNDAVESLDLAFTLIVHISMYPVKLDVDFFTFSSSSW